MSNEIDLRRAAHEIFDVALASVDAGEAMRRAIQLEGTYLRIHDTTINLANTSQPIYVLAIGKAAFPMASALDDLIGERIKEGYIVGTHLQENTYRNFFPSRNEFNPWSMGIPAHPLPTKSSLEAAKAVFGLLQRADENRALIIFLVSGGGSSMIEWPRDDQITLADLRAANSELISCGASISEINAVRRGFSDIKGGRLAARAPNADQVTLIISDTVKGQEATVASGPTCEPPSHAPDASDVIEQYRLAEKLPPAILRAVYSPKDLRSKLDHNRLRKQYVLLDNESALSAAADEARRKGFFTETASDISEQPIIEGCKMMLARIVDLQSLDSRKGKVACLISGGEFSCPVRGKGVGGRNTETVLRCAINIGEIQTQNRSEMNAIRFAILSAGTDGIDGNSPAAGAIATEKTVERARMLGLKPGDFLERSDAFSFFDALDDAVVTGPTGTNVRDLRIILAG